MRVEILANSSHKSNGIRQEAIYFNFIFDFGEHKENNEKKPRRKDEPRKMIFQFFKSR